MDDIENFIMRFVEEQEVGDITDIIRYLSKLNIDIKQNLSELKQLIIELLKKNDNIITDFSGRFQVTPNIKEIQPVNQFASNKNIMVGTIIQKGTIKYIDIYHQFTKRISDFGKLKCNVPNKFNNFMNGFLDLDNIQVAFTFNQDNFTIKASMKERLDFPDSLMIYLFNLNKGIKKQYGGYIPLNFGIFLIYMVFRDSLRDCVQDFTLKIDDINYIH
ncbi:MAG: hypothetical protein ACTSRG_21270 [Candidatus Helarchaeota archaeon]